MTELKRKLATLTTEDIKEGFELTVLISIFFVALISVSPV